MLKFGNQIFRFAFVGIILPFALQSQEGYSQFLNPSVVQEGDKVTKIKIFGNQTVSQDAILNSMSIKPDSIYNKTNVSEDIKSIYATGFFQDVKINKLEGGEINVVVVEKPTIENISFEGFEAVTSTSLKDKLVTKKYTILDEKKISQDLRKIEEAYLEKGYYLAKASYKLEETSEGNLKVTFSVNENTPVTVRNVSIVGNQFFSDNELFAFMGTKSFSWLSFFGSSGIYKDEYASTDQQNLIYYYRDNGYAEANVAAPTSILSKDKTDINVTYYIEQGEKFHIGKISIEGDILPKSTAEITKAILNLQEGDLYKISQFNNDMKLLKTFYGNFGYAFAYIYPKFKIDRKNKTYDIIYTISKGEKAYFRKIIVEGNLKTRDNVIRRSLLFTEGELYNSSRLEISKDYVNRLGFFDNDVLLVEEPDKANNAVDVRIAVKEKSTGNLQASLGASPSTNGESGVTFFGSVQYQEKNLFGRAYGLSTNIQISPSPEKSTGVNYSLGVNFGNPSIYDGPWSYSLNGNYQKQVQVITTTADIAQIYYTQKVVSAGFVVGREIIRNLRFSLGYTIANYSIDPSMPLTEKFLQSGKIEEVSQSLVYDNTDSYMNPSAGFYVSAVNAVGMKILNGQYNYGLFSGAVNYYIPLKFTDEFKTNFRFTFIPKIIYRTTTTGIIPIWKRLFLGDSYQMKGYSSAGERIGPTIPVTISPVNGYTVPLNYGGTKSYYAVGEYFVPLVPEAGLRFVAFGEAGTVLSEQQSFSMSNMNYDVGFGFRWITPVAPFRFEWAFPVQNGQLGKSHFVFTIGYDNVNS